MSNTGVINVPVILFPSVISFPCEEAYFGFSRVSNTIIANIP